MSAKGTAKLLTDLQACRAEKILQSRIFGVKKKSKILNDQDALEFEKKMIDKNFIQNVVRDWERM